MLDLALAEGPDGKWAAREVGLIVPRQNGKGSIIEALLVASLFLFDDKLILYSAHEFKTAQETFLRVKALIEASDDLRSRVAKFPSAHGAEGVELHNGNRLRFIARTKGSGRGFSPQRVFLDEALNLSERSVAALMFAMSAQPNPQLMYASSHPENDVPEGDVLRAVMRRGRAGDPTLAYAEWCAEDDADPEDEAQIQQANPGHPHRIQPATVAMERGAISPEHFARERMGIVDIRAREAGDALPEELWAACRDDDYTRGDRVVYGLEVDQEGYAASIGASDGAFVQVVAWERGSLWLPDRLLEVITERPGTVVLNPSGPAAALTAALDERGIEWEPVASKDYAAACAAFLAAVVEDQSVRHRGQPVLDIAIKQATKRTFGDSWAWDRRRPNVSISPLVSVTIARWVASTTDPADYDVLASVF